MGDGSGSVVFVLRLCLLVLFEVLSFQLMSLDKTEMTYSLQEKGTIILSTGMLAAADGEHLPTKSR
jgi:hypothetical protein